MSMLMLKLAVFSLCVLQLVLMPCSTSHAVIGCNLASQYSAKPIFVTNSVTPNVLILFSNDHTNFYAGYNSPAYDDTIEYYGYFDPKKEYNYGNDQFIPVGYVNYNVNHRVTSSYRWSGNFLNWLTMCHADFVRKALTGGRRSIDSSDHTILERGDIPNDGHKWSRTIADAGLYTPFSGLQTFTNVGLTVFRDADNDQFKDSDEQGYTVRVEVCDADVGVEENAIYYENGHVWKPEGLLQHFKDKVNFGLMTYSYGKPEAGGVLRVNVKDISEEVNPSGGTIANADGIMGFINGFDAKGWDPLAEMYYEAIRYFKALTPTPEFTVNSPDGGFKVLCNQGGQTHNWVNPIQSWCQKNFIIMVNDEYPSKDSNSLPGSSWPTSISGAGGLNINVTELTKKVGEHEGINGTSRDVGNVIGNQNNACGAKTVNNLGQARGICPSESDAEGSFYVGGLAHYAHSSDLRSDLSGDQTITTYGIAFRASPEGYQVPPPPMNQLYLATKYGGFSDLNDNGLPDAGEWEGETRGGYTWPKNFAHAESGKDFEASMLKILTDIIRQASSGTAASVVTSSEGGEGQLYQAYFEGSHPSLDGTTEATWIGFLHSLWIDPYGNIREDSDGDGALVVKTANNTTLDKIVKVRFDDSDGTTKVERYLDNNGDGIEDPNTDTDGDNEPDTAEPISKVNLSDLDPIWEASHQLGQRNLDEVNGHPRTIKTFADKDLNGSVDANEYIDFNLTNKNVISPFLQVDASDRDNLISYIRGNEISGWRNRTVDNQKYLLGDIVHSTPTPVGRPMDNYDVIYGDKTYLAYLNKYRYRPTYLYTGANDGMLHAFYGGIFRPYDNLLTPTKTESAYIETEVGKTLGEEAWAYIPKNLLPHLKWLTCPDYPHIYYVDLKPKVVDARIFDAEWNNPNGTHPYGWGTILIGGMRLGGSNITVRADFDGVGGATTASFKSAYFAIDVTDPTNPQLLWEKTYDQLGFTFSYPAVLRLQSGNASPSSVAHADQKWMLLLGNGPIDFNGDPGGKGFIYVTDLKTGQLARAFDVSTVSVPGLSGSYKEFMASPASVDLKLNYDVDVVYMGSVIKTSQGYQGRMYRLVTDNGDADVTPNWNVNEWSLSSLINVEKPITAAPGVSQIDDKIWVYFGTGRYIGMQDKSNTDRQSFYGIKDPNSFHYGEPAITANAGTDLVNVSNIKLYETGHVTGLSNGQQSWNDLLNLFKDNPDTQEDESKSGFVRNLEQPTGYPSERILVKPAIIGGLCLFPSFFPSNDICDFSGDSRLYALYYRTGTAFKKDIIGTNANDTVIVTNNGNSQVLENINAHVDLGPGLPSQVAIHAGKESGGTSLTQLSTSAIVDPEFNPAEPMKSGFIYWRELD